MRCIADTAPQLNPSSGLPRAGPRTVSLREFLPRDVPHIALIVAEALHEHYDNSLYLSLGQQWPEGFLVATDEHDRPVGFLLGVSQIEGEARILMFAVDRDWRVQGVGLRLMETFLERARGRGMRRATGLKTRALLSRQAVQLMGIDQSFSAARVSQALGWEPRVDYPDGLRETLAWLRAEGL